ncbi:TIM barrel protein [Candidatus Woesearchaeota archaeon]|nr:TIM barrel protein [Candidatus Woesearchaeota archaeon]MBW3021588.1 TIM barrel protein [Candidatus Woesearchaeota archaeon]
MILFGPAGLSSKPEQMIDWVKKSGLGVIEIAFTHSVYMNNNTAKQVGAYAKQKNVALTIHAPYYINLTSQDKEKINASKKRILAACERGHFLGAKSVVFHAAYYQTDSKEETYSKVAEEIKDMQSYIKKNKWNIKLAPETTGKASQFGDVDEIMQLRKDTGCMPCIDFAHIYARNNGKIDYTEIFKKIKSLPHLHAHFSGIEYTAKGERRHIPLKKPFFIPLANHLRKWKKPAHIICESPDPPGDALKMLNWFKKS